jgi:hypothetical protein
MCVGFCLTGGGGLYVFGGFFVAIWKACDLALTIPTKDCFERSPDGPEHFL